MKFDRGVRTRRAKVNLLGTPARSSMRDDDRGAVLVAQSAGVPSAARGAAAQRVNGQTQLVTGLERAVRPTVPGQAVGAVAFEVPDDLVRILVQDLQDDEHVRAREPE